MHILVIDDEPDIREIAQFALERIGGHAVTTASSAEAGIAIARVGGIDVVLMDVMMPVMDGISAAAVLQSFPETADLPVVLLTAKGVHEVKSSVRVTGVIIKPFDPLTLAHQLEKLLGWQE